LALTLCLIASGQKPTMELTFFTQHFWLHNDDDQPNNNKRNTEPLAHIQHHAAFELNLGYLNKFD